LRIYISKNESELCYDDGSPIQPIQYNKETKHALNTKQKKLIINKIESEWAIFAKVFDEFLEERKYMLSKSSD